MPIAAIAFDFDPYLRLGDRAIALQTLGIAAAVLVMLLGAALVARRTRGDLLGPPPDLPPLSIRPDWPIVPSRLRLDDLLFIAVGAAPGAIVGGRLGHVLIHLDFYSARPSAILDPGQGSLELGLAVVGGAVGGAIVASILDGRVGTWLGVASGPMLAGLALGKVALALGGAGQGMPLGAGAAAGLPGVGPEPYGWPASIATAYLGSGPWGSLDPATPAWPSQLLEAGLVVIALLVFGALLGSGRLGRTGGRPFLVAVGLWAAARFAVAFTWRDAAVVGALRADQLISLGIAVGAVALYASRVLRDRRRRMRAATPRMPATTIASEPPGQGPAVRTIEPRS